MQRIDVSILNGCFALAFGGALVLGVVAAVLHRHGGGRSALPWIVAAVVLCGTSLVVTMGLNVPLNDRLAAAGEPAGISGPAAVREKFETAWVRWNTARTLTYVAALGCLGRALRATRAAGCG
ncbi:DUF1772 domain-containing protein [Actinacidiphila sp. ITFR-21]|uniref:anthrone oxygenase family protein n=1 Tax=Actinacidiphila sp. ITFR-21 TaxID=3075199 RepID=UPI0028890162|nr:anthrone oxygenase family protein [Streptomyces sp. ITFR-21]WNI18624.1 DUF1772 domain-containing protein [Streptomyces sp. ITFR-21]